MRFNQWARAGMVFEHDLTITQVPRKNVMPLIKYARLWGFQALVLGNEPRKGKKATKPLDISITKKAPDRMAKAAKEERLAITDYKHMENLAMGLNPRVAMFLKHIREEEQAHLAQLNEIMKAHVERRFPVDIHRDSSH